MSINLDEIQIPEINVRVGVQEADPDNGDEDGFVIVEASLGDIAVELAFPNTGQIDEAEVAFLLQAFPQVAMAALEQMEVEDGQ